MEKIHITITCPDQSEINILAYYCPPNLKIDQIEETLENDFDLIKNKNYIILGDFNINLLKNDDKTERYKELLKIYNLENLINTPTRVTKNSKTLIDHLITNEKSIIKHINNASLDITDHHVITFDISTEEKHNNKNTNDSNQTNKNSTKIKYDTSTYLTTLTNKIIDLPIEDKYFKFYIFFF